MKAGFHNFALEWGKIRFIFSDDMDHRFQLSLMKKILVATGNKGKAQELLEAFGEMKFEFLLLSDFPEVEEPDETANSFGGNALLKAKYFGDKFLVPTIGEDSGLILDAFPDKFGLRTRREFEADSDEEWLEKFMKMLHGVENRNATFYSAIGYYDPINNIEQTFQGETSGVITEELRTEMEQGIPVSSVFIPNGKNSVYSAMTKEGKCEVSHRGKAVAKFKLYIENSV